MKYVFPLLAAFVVVSLIGAFSERDSTDAPNGKRSGVRLHTDHLTGCQYLSVPLGGLTPRMDSAGRHLGCKT